MMKASIGRLRKLTSHKVDAKEKGELVATALVDELARAGKVNFQIPLFDRVKTKFRNFFLFLV